MREKLFTTVSIPIQTATQLDHIAKITGISKTTLLERITESLFGLSCNYDYATFGVDYSVLEGMVHITLRGYPRVTVSHFKISETATDKEVDALIAQKTLEKAEQDNNEIFGET